MPIDQDGMFALYTDGCELTAPGWAGKGRPGLLEFSALGMTAFPDNRVVVPSSSGRQVSVPFVGMRDVRGETPSTTRFNVDQVEMFGRLGLAAG